MQRAYYGLALTLVVLNGQGLWAENSDRAGEASSLAVQALSVDAGVAKSARQALRELGPAGLQALLAIEPAATEPQAAQYRAALEAVAAQRDCQASHLYWYTDLEKAIAAAQAAHKPILSLHMLGQLTDEFSCANSRYFRSTLYANEQIGRLLREGYVLHWQSVRPVPLVTIDFGDGRTIKRTLTGNSIHYILDSQGRVVDALPGLYGPQAFVQGLENAGTLLASLESLAAPGRAQRLVEYHSQAALASDARWRADLESLNVPLPAHDFAALQAATNDVDWNRVAALHQGLARLDAASVALIGAQNPDMLAANRLSMSKAIVENPLFRLIRTFEQTAAVDTVRNEYTLHRQLHDWFAAGQVPVELPLATLNERVYSQLFLTPSSDPWLGLLPAGYTALTSAGVTVAASPE